MNELILERLRKLSEEVAFLKKESADLKKAVFLIHAILARKRQDANEW